MSTPTIDDCFRRAVEMARDALGPFPMTAPPCEVALESIRLAVNEALRTDAVADDRVRVSALRVENGNIRIIIEAASFEL